MIRSASSGLIGREEHPHAVRSLGHDLVEHLGLEGLRVDDVGDAPAVIQVEHHPDVAELKVEVDERHARLGLHREGHREVGREHRLTHAALAGEEHDDLAEGRSARSAGGVRGCSAGEGALLLLELVHAADGRHQLVVAEWLDEVLASTGLHRTAQVVPLALDRHDDDRRGGQFLSEALRELDAVHDRHVHVGEHDVGQQAVRFLEALLAIARGADDLDVLFEPEEFAQVVPGARDVVDDEEPDQIDRDLSPPSSVLPVRGRPGCPVPWWPRS